MPPVFGVPLALALALVPVLALVGADDDVHAARTPDPSSPAPATAEYRRKSRRDVVAQHRDTATSGGARIGAAVLLSHEFLLESQT